MYPKKDDKGIVSSEALVVDDICRDASAVFYHEKTDLFGVIRILPRDAMIAHNFSRLEEKIEPFLLRYLAQLDAPAIDVKAKVCGGEYRWNELEPNHGILLARSEDFLIRNILEYLPELELRAIEHIQTDPRAIKTITVRPRGVIEIAETVPEINKEQGFDYNQFMFVQRDST